MENKIVSCTPILPKSLASEYSLSTFPKRKAKMGVMATVRSSDELFCQVENGWINLRAKLQQNNEELASSFTHININDHCSILIDCGFYIVVPPNHELHFRTVEEFKQFLILDASTSDGHVFVLVFNTGGWRQIDNEEIIGQVCVRPVNNIMIHTITDGTIEIKG